MFLNPFDAIVVGVDFSDYSKTVVKQAIVLSELWKTKLIFVHAFNEPIDAAPTLYVSIRKNLGPHYYRDHIKTFYGLKNRRFESVVDFSTPTRLISATAKKFKRSLIIVGYKGSSRLAEILFGSTARHLVSKVRTPIWVHRGNEVINPKRVLIAHDLSKESNRGVDIFKQLNLVQRLDYQVYFVREKPFPVLDYTLYKSIEREQLLYDQKKIRSLLAKYPRLHFQTTTGEATEKIVEKTRKFDLVLISHRKNKEFYSSSETLQLMRKSEKPLLVV